MKYYKGFNADMTCKNFQYKEGGDYREEKAEVCKTGFHACEYPLDCFSYYAPGNSVYHEVEMGEDAHGDGEDSKKCSKTIKIGAQINLGSLAPAAVEFIMQKVDFKDAPATNTGDRSAATNTGYQSAASVEGDGSVAIVTGYQSKAKGALGCAIVIAERGARNGETYPLLAIKAAIVDGETIKADTWYTLRKGEFVEESHND